MIDVLVVGAGPVGLSAALAAARRGLDVALLDPHEGVIDKACGEGLMPATLEALASLGVHPAGRDVLGIRYLRDGVTAEARFHEPARGVRRTTLSAALGEATAAAGVRRLVGRASQITLHDDHVTVDGLEARWLVGADGLRSTVRTALELDAPSTAPRRYGLRQHFRVAPWADTVDVHWADDAEAYVTPVSDEVVGIAFLFGDAARQRDRGDPHPPFERLLARFPELEARLAGAEPASHPRGAGPFDTRSSARTRGRALLVGDAAGYVDALTGEGMKVGILAALAAVDAIEAGDLRAYERAWRRLWRPYAWSTKGLLAVTAVPPLRRALPSLLRWTPGLMKAVVNTIGG